MTQPSRLRDLADVQDLIRILRLGVAFAYSLDPYVRDMFQELIHMLGQSDPHVEEQA